MRLLLRLLLGLLRAQTLLRRLHIFELLADFGQAHLQFIHGVVERLDLAGKLVDLRAAFALLLLQRCLQPVQSIRHFIDRVGVLLDQILHDAHALVEAALHGRHLFLQLLHLRLQLHHVLVSAPCRSDSQPEHREQCEQCRNAM